MRTEEGFLRLQEELQLERDKVRWLLSLFEGEKGEKRTQLLGGAFLMGLSGQEALLAAMEAEKKQKEREG